MKRIRIAETQRSPEGTPEKILAAGAMTEVLKWRATGKMAINEALFSSASCEWETPQDFFDEWDAKFHFDLDCCATDENAKCARYFMKEDDAFRQKWTGRVWMNPPYGRDIGLWMRKAYESVLGGDAEVVVCLVPSRTDTKWFHEYAMSGELHFVRGRLKFGGSGSKNSAPFPSVVVVFEKKGDEDS